MDTGQHPYGEGASKSDTPIMSRNHSYPDQPPESLRVVDFRRMSVRQAHIGSGLRAMYSDIAARPLPGEFADLLAQIDEIDDASCEGSCCGQSASD
ncbi:NepR family anti-sigma factor [Blastomonas sp.]|uniref:NepR family anti-sigma factor n=1 Tax=Blastomonas sp. TaxID=1909299 RepID=UPI0035939347